MKIVKWILTQFRQLNLTAIAKKYIGATYGWFASFFGGFIIKALENFLDYQTKKAESAIDVKEKDKEIDNAAQTKIDNIEKAKTDEELDEAMRDGLR